MGNITTAVNYISYLENTYLLFSIPGYYPSPRQQLINPKKTYAIDTGLIRANTLSFSEDTGRMLENIVFLQLRRKYKSIFYHKGEHECDFIIKDRGAITGAFQVCMKLDEYNMKREIAGLEEVMKKFKLATGLILTMDQEDKFGDIEVIPVWKWITAQYA